MSSGSQAPFRNTPIISNKMIAFHDLNHVVRGVQESNFLVIISSPTPMGGWSKGLFQTTFSLFTYTGDGVLQSQNHL